mmetsp:Transcript_6397/g.23705  ORF Transcript_6397/g.23705 Transcript_6397/m.23705 type:complete len:215 (+) Transcript_6397:139-783(+)
MHGEEPVRPIGAPKLQDGLHPRRMILEEVREVIHLPVYRQPAVVGATVRAQLLQGNSTQGRRHCCLGGLRGLSAPTFQPSHDLLRHHSTEDRRFGQRIAAQAILPMQAPNYLAGGVQAANHTPIVTHHASNRIYRDASHRVVDDWSDMTSPKASGCVNRHMIEDLLPERIATTKSIPVVTKDGSGKSRRRNIPAVRQEFSNVFQRIEVRHEPLA